MSTNNEGKHPAAANADQLAWAVWVDDGRSRECYAVTGDSKAAAREKAIARHDGEGGEVHIDGPFPDAEPGVWEFEYVTEHRETVTVEGPSEDYAAETASQERTFKGQYVQTIHTESRRVSPDPNPARREDDTEAER